MKASQAGTDDHCVDLLRPAKAPATPPRETEQIDASEAEAEPTAEQLAEMEAADAAAATEAPEADPEEKE